MTARSFPDASAGEAGTAGPILYARGSDAAATRLSVLHVQDSEAAPPEVAPGEREPAPPRLLLEAYGRSYWRCDIELRPGEMGYRIGPDVYPVVTDLTGDLRVAYVSCNGQEHGDDGRDIDERDLMWLRLCEEHRRAPFALLLHGGDQLYADEVVDCHPDFRRWKDLSPSRRGEVAFTPQMREAARLFFLSRYLNLLSQPAIAWMLARVPSLMMWDDHDIFDGWGSHAAEVQDSAVGQGIFAVAREAFALFQMCGPAQEPPSICIGPEGQSYSFAARFPGLSVIAPDLRSGRRPDRVMSEDGWRCYEAALRSTPRKDRLLLMSSVPGLGPRLSWVEAALDYVPRTQNVEDDLRDQWQSRMHRKEWRRFLQGLERVQVEGGAGTTLLSGEIHVATRGEMRLGNGSKLHQLIASGISHPPPSRAYPLALGILARFGESPLPGRPVRMRPLPGKRGVYTAERNFLVLTRSGESWSAEWELEESGRTPPLRL